MYAREPRRQPPGLPSGPELLGQRNPSEPSETCNLRLGERQPLRAPPLPLWSLRLGTRREQGVQPLAVLLALSFDQVPLAVSHVDVKGKRYRRGGRRSASARQLCASEHPIQAV